MGIPVNGPDEFISSDLPERTRRKITAGSHWIAIKNQLVNAAMAQACLPPHTVCGVCNSSLAVSRCEYCGPRQYFCLDCCKMWHRSRNYLHIPELWENNTFIPMLANEVPLKQTDHHCALKEIREIICIDEHGSHHLKSIEFCQCEHPSITLLKLNLWPGSPERPKVAFHIKLMELVEMLFLQCHVPLYNICKLLDNRRNALLPKLVHSVYDILNSDTFEEYRQHKFVLHKLDNLCAAVGDRSICRLCPKDDGVYIESMDACFGLARKKCKGEGLYHPRHGTLFFADQDDVDNFVENYKGTNNHYDKDCSQFHAGEVLTSIRSKGKNELFDEKGVFGRVCRHDFPQGFINVKHGERISYSVYETERIMQKTGNKPGIKVVLMYDIACTLDAHLKANNPIVGPTDKITFSIPVFHCYGHKGSCHVKYSPRRIEGVGLTDGEGVERLWSFLRQFSRITKEMAADKRIDVLTDALLHHCDNITQNFGPVLKAKLLRAQSLHQNCTTNLDTLLKSLPVLYDERTIKSWIEDELSLSTNSDNEITFAWDEQYVGLLLDIKQLRSNVESGAGDSDELDTIWETNMARLEKKESLLASFERKHHLRKTWDESDRGFVAAKKRLLEKQKALALRKLHTLAAERTFLLEIKKKYADGQAIAIKLGKQITRVTKNVNKALTSFNLMEDNAGVTFDVVKDPNAGIYQLLNATNSQNDVPLSVKRKIIDWYTLKERAKEEEELVSTEMKRLRDSYIKELEALTHLLIENELDDNEQANPGLRSLLNRKKLVLTKTVLKLATLWDGLVHFCFNSLQMNCVFYKHLGDNTGLSSFVQEELAEDEIQDCSDWDTLSCSEESENDGI